MTKEPVDLVKSLPLLSFLRCRGEHRGEDASAGVCPEQEEGARPAQPQPRRPPKRRSVLVPVSNTHFLHHHKKRFKCNFVLTCRPLHHKENTFQFLCNDCEQLAPVEALHE